jgi:hypothetical protein
MNMEAQSKTRVVVLEFISLLVRENEKWHKSTEAQFKNLIAGNDIPKIKEKEDYFINWIRQCPESTLKVVYSNLKNKGIDLIEVLYLDDPMFQSLVSGKEIKSHKEYAIAFWFCKNAPRIDEYSKYREVLKARINTYNQKRKERNFRRLKEGSLQRLEQINKALYTILEFLLTKSTNPDVMFYYGKSQELLNFAYDLYDLRGLMCMKADLINMIKDMRVSERNQLNEHLIEEIQMDLMQIKKL